MQKTSAVVVPLRTSSSRKNSATSRACAGSENLLQPIEQPAASRADYVGLRVVNVRIDEAGDQDVLSVIDDLGSGWQARQQLARRSERRDSPVRSDQQSVLQELETSGVVIRPRIGAEMKNGASMRAQSCGAVSAERHVRSRRALRLAPPR